MKKLLLLLTLSFFSIQSFAGSCPDGSEPIKSISEDGTYFVFNCGGANEASSSNTDSSNTKSNSNQAYQSFPVHEFAKSPLRDLKAPENWKLFKDPSELDLFHERFKGPVHENQPINSWKMQNYVDDCERGISEFDQNFRLNEDKLSTSFIRCATVFTHRHFRDRAEGIKTFERILLSWAKTKPVIYAANSNDETIVGSQAYAASMLMGDFASFYAVYYDDFDFTREQRQSVERYLSDWLINHDLTLPGFPICNLNNINQFKVGGTNRGGTANYCGSNRWRMGIGAVYLGLRTGNQELFTAGNRHIEINLATIDKDGINAVWAGKGAYALSYLRQFPEVLTLLSVAYESIGYDFYEHQLPHGKKIHEVYEALFDFIYHPEKLNKYAHGERYYGGKGNPGVIDVYEFDKLPLSEKWNREMISPEILAAESKGYVIRYRPDLMDKIEYKKTWGYNPNKQAEWKWGEYGQWEEHVSRFVNISGLAIYEAFNQNVSKLIIQDQIELEIELAIKQKKVEQEQEENRLRLKKNAEAIKAKKAQEQEQLLAEIPIYDMNDETLILNIALADFTETSPPKEQSKNAGWERHKAEISGELSMGSFKVPEFRPLAFKYILYNESRLSINVGDLNAPEFNPFKRHRTSLQKECGLELMNEYDWMSFVSKTTNMKSAKNQQCHYNYFKDANDEEAWKLFQAVLGGTDSILHYLQNKVAP
ncbi:hypothetical protein OAH81_00015 [Candidatus Pseudothioglobus singularis]|nr:hypothetical protein [Candidatus Pseudothioglobus singularis]MDB4821409.1 hypothetical protein [Candidatus Pseudothioglobus singularis]